MVLEGFLCTNTLCPPTVASLPAIYGSLEVLRAENRERVSKKSSRAFQPGVSKKSRKGRKVPRMTLFGDFSGTFRPFRDFFETPGWKAREDFFQQLKKGVFGKGSFRNLCEELCFVFFCVLR